MLLPPLENDLSVAECLLAAAVKAGTVWVNTYNRYDPGSPFGGFKSSGFGRDLGRQALEEYTQTKSVWVSLQ